MSDENTGSSGIDLARFARSMVLIAAVTTVFLFVGAQRLEGDLLRIGAVAIGSVAIVTAITAFLIAGVDYTDQWG